MKKFLLFAAAALVAVSASAQVLSSRQTAGKAQTARNHSQALKETKMTATPMAVRQQSKQLEIASVPTKRMLPAKAMPKGNMKAATPYNAASIMRAAEVQKEYTATGKSYDFDAQNYVKVDPWKMLSGVSEDGISYLVDIVPNPFNGLDGVPVVYTLEGNTITIEPQVIVTYDDNDGNTNYVFVDGYTDDGSIEMTLDDNGSIAISSSLAIYYDVFTSDEFDPEFTHVEDGGTYRGSYAIAKGLKYLLPGQIEAPVVMYNPDAVYLHLAYSNSGYGYYNNLAMIPAGAPVPFANFTDDPADTWSWRMPGMEYMEALELYIETDEVLEGAEENFAPVTTPGGFYSAPELKGSFQGATSEPYIWGKMREKAEYESFASAGEMAAAYEMSDGTYAMATKANPDNSLAYHPGLATPDANSWEYSWSSLIFYQGKPSAPLYFEGINMYVKDFEAYEGIDLKCKIQKVTRNSSGRISLGEVIAQADLNPDDIETNWVTELRWTEFYREDELGMSEALDYLQIDEEFAIVLEGWDNGTFTATPYVEYYSNDNGFAGVYFSQTGDEPGKYYSFTNSTYNAYVGFIGAIYGYLYTEDATDLSFGNEGGEATLHVNAMLRSYNSEEDAYSVRLFAEEGTEVPEWLTIETANVSDNCLEYDLVVKAEALPAGEEYREAVVELMQEGAKLTITVKQGTPTGITTTVKATPAKTGRFNIAGQRVGNNAKGVIIENGKRIIRK